MSTLFQVLPLLLAILGISSVVADHGFRSIPEIEPWFDYIYASLAVFYLAQNAIRIWKHRNDYGEWHVPQLITQGFGWLVVMELISGIVIGQHIDPNHIYTFIFFFIIGMVEFSRSEFRHPKLNFSPSVLFTMSFALTILFGSIMMLLPTATIGDLSFTDAVFTATSATCVTGLSVVDTGMDKVFTMKGHLIILTLIQVGGLGMMTFSSFFGFFFKGQSSIRESLKLKDITSSVLSDVRTFIIGVLSITFLIEGLGALAIFLLMPKEMSPVEGKVFFSIYHAISAFCNAGFSTLSSGLFDEQIKFSYGVQWVVASLFITGGIGYFILFNGYSYLKYHVLRWWARHSKSPSPIRPAHIVSLSTKIVVVTTIILLIIGTIVFWLLENHNTLADHHSFLGKLTVSFFSGATTRTAGFNAVDMTVLRLPTLLFMILLMWVGASPGSTGGGIKTTVFAVATLNFYHLAQGKEKIHLLYREISDITIRRTFAIISLSLIFIGFGIFLISIFDSDLPLIGIAFEVFSAYSTTGLSAGITSSLSDSSKWVLIFLMFAGRVNSLTLLIAIFRQVKNPSYSLPKEDLLIN